MWLVSSGRQSLAEPEPAASMRARAASGAGALALASGSFLVHVQAHGDGRHGLHAQVAPLHRFLPHFCKPLACQSCMYARGQSGQQARR